MRVRHGMPNQTVEMRAASNTYGRGGGRLEWGGTKSQCLGGLIVIAPVYISGVSTTVLDESIDWTDRIIQVTGHLELFWPVTEAVPGGANESDLYERGFAAGGYGRYSDVFYSAAGWDGTTARVDAAFATNHYNFTSPFDSVAGTVRTDLFLYAASGSLGRLTIKNTNAALGASGALVLIASEPTGKRSTVP